jgi:hypothetical protein
VKQIVPLFSMFRTEFVEMFVGVGASQFPLFRQAKKMLRASSLLMKLMQLDVPEEKIQISEAMMNGKIPSISC